MKEKDLGVLITSDLKSDQHCSQVIKTDNKVADFIGRFIENISEKKLYQIFLIRSSDPILSIVYSSGPFITKRQRKAGKDPTQSDKSHALAEKHTL